MATSKVNKPVLPLLGKVDMAAASLSCITGNVPPWWTDRQVVENQSMRKGLLAQLAVMSCCHAAY